MTLLDQWLRPPRSLLVGLFLLTLASISTLAWFGFRLLDQERLVEAQHAREHLEQSADRIAATLRLLLAESEGETRKRCAEACEDYGQC